MGLFPPADYWKWAKELDVIADDNYAARSADLKAKGFALAYDNVFKGCDGQTRHQALWTKGGG